MIGPRLLAIGFVASIALHLAGFAFFSSRPEQAEMAAARGGTVSVVGSLQDMIEGAQADLEPVRTEAKALPVSAAPTPSRPIMEQTPATRPEETRAEEVARTAQLEIDHQPAKRPDFALPVDSNESPEAPPDAAASDPVPVPVKRPVDQDTRSQPRDADRSEPVERDERDQAVKPEPERNPVEQERQATQVEPTRLKEVADPPQAPPKTKPRKKPSKPAVATSRRGGETNARRGGQRANSTTGKSNAIGRRDGFETVGGKAARDNYIGGVLRRLQRQKRYPAEARRNRMSGTAIVSFTVSASGAVSGVRLVRSSGHKILDQEAIAMVRRASPMPPIPKSAGRSRIAFRAPVRFHR